MKQFLIFLFALIGGYLFANFLFILFLKKYDNEFAKVREAFSLKNQSVSQVIIGNSTAMDGINAEILAKNFGTAYNFSVGGATLKSNYLQLETYLKNNRKPERVILCLSTGHVRYVPTEEINPTIEYHYLPSSKYNDITCLPLFKFRWLFMENVKKLFSRQHREVKIVLGQFQTTRTIPDVTKFQNSTSNPFDNNIYNKDGYTYLLKMVALCQKMGINVIVVEMPCWKAWQNYYPDCYFNAGGKISPVKVINLNNKNRCDTLFNSNTDWLSKNHLNFSGSTKLTGYLITNIK